MLKFYVLDTQIQFHILVEQIYGFPGTNSDAFTHCSGGLGVDGSSGGFVWPPFFSDVIFSSEISVLLCKGFRVLCKGACFETGGFGLVWSYLLKKVKPS